jgi:hypothetical protein
VACDLAAQSHPCLRKPRLVVSHHLPHHPPPLPLACTSAPHTHQHAALARPRSRIEYFVFSLLAEMQGHEVQLYAILLDGALNRYPEVTVSGEVFMPSGGALANPNDKALVTDLEDKMIEAYGTALVEVKCKVPAGARVDLKYKMLRPQHVGALFAAVERYKVTELDLARNQLGADGGALVAAALETNTTLTKLECAQLGRPSNQGQGLAVSLEGPTHYLHWPFSPWLPRLRRLHYNDLGPEGGMALAEALKSNTTLTELRSAALPSNPPAHALRPHSMDARCTGPLHVFLRRLRSLGGNDLGPEGGMALAEALKSNTTLTELRSAALPSNPPAHALRPHSMDARCTGPLHVFLRRLRSLGGNKLGPEGGMALAEALKSNTTLKWLLSAALPSNPPAHASRSFPALRASVHLTPFLVPWKHLKTRPARALHATSHSLRVSRTSPARAQPTHSLHTRRASCLLAAAPVPTTPPHPAWTAATPSFAHGWVAKARAPSRLQPARRSLVGNGLGADAKQALTAAARDGLELEDL